MVFVYEVLCATEIAMAKTTNPSSERPDGLMLGALKRTPIRLLACAINLWMVFEHLPSSMRVGRTVLNPKVPSPTEPKDSRPITVASHLARLLIRI